MSCDEMERSSLSPDRTMSIVSFHWRYLCASAQTCYDTIRYVRVNIVTRGYRIVDGDWLWLVILPMFVALPPANSWSAAILREWKNKLAFSNFPRHCVVVHAYRTSVPDCCFKSNGSCVLWEMFSSRFLCHRGRGSYTVAPEWRIAKCQLVNYCPDTFDPAVDQQRDNPPMPPRTGALMY